MRLLLYCLHSVMVLFTPELLCWGLIGNVQSRRLLINAVSGFWQHKQTVAQSPILLHKGYTYGLTLGYVQFYYFIITVRYEGLYVNGSGHITSTTRGNSKQNPNMTEVRGRVLVCKSHETHIANQTHSGGLDASSILAQQTALLEGIGGRMAIMSTHHRRNGPNTVIYTAEKPESFHTCTRRGSWSTCLVVGGTKRREEQPYGIKRTQVRGLPTTSGRLD